MPRRPTAVAMSLRLRLLGAACAVGIAACSSDNTPTQPPVAAIAGTYGLDTLRITETGRATVDARAAGATMDITITSAGTVTGNLSLPASVAGGTPFTASMAGTATVVDGRVRFTQSADTFVESISWQIVGTRLRADTTVSGARIQAVLARR